MGSKQQLVFSLLMLALLFHLSHAGTSSTDNDVVKADKSFWGRRFSWTKTTEPLPTAPVDTSTASLDNVIAYIDATGLLLTTYAQRAAYFLRNAWKLAGAFSNIYWILQGQSNIKGAAVTVLGALVAIIVVLCYLGYFRLKAWIEACAVAAVAANNSSMVLMATPNQSTEAVVAPSANPRSTPVLASVSTGNSENRGGPVDHTLKTSLMATAFQSLRRRPWRQLPEDKVTTGQRTRSNIIKSTSTPKSVTIAESNSAEHGNTMAELRHSNPRRTNIFGDQASPTPHKPSRASHQSSDPILRKYASDAEDEDD